MPLKKLLLKPGVNRENTRYTTEGGWYECDKIRFRQGNPEKIGGWTPFSSRTFEGICRSLWSWVTLAGETLVSLGTSVKFYISRGSFFYDVTPIRATAVLTNPFTATEGSNTISTFAEDHGCKVGDSVEFSGAGISGLGGNVTVDKLTGTFVVTAVINADVFSFAVDAVADAADVAGSPGGGTVVTQFVVSGGPPYQIPLTGWGAGAWGLGAWGTGTSQTSPMQLWSQANFGEDLVYGPRGGGVYYWSARIGVTPVSCTISIGSPALITLPAGYNVDPGLALTFTSSGVLPTGLTVGQIYFAQNTSGTTFNVSKSLGGALIATSGTQSGVQRVSNRGISLAPAPLGACDAGGPLFQNRTIVSDASRFILVFGTNDYGKTEMDPMLIRWSAQEDPFTWFPAPTNQAGSLRLSNGSEIIAAIQSKQEIVVLTDQAVYALQYLGPPFVWGSQILGDNISIVGPNAVTVAAGSVFWMGVDKFYSYDGRVQTLNCDLRRFVFGDFNQQQRQQVYASTNEGFNEIWWFYCSANSVMNDRYVVYNYLEQIWYYGSLDRTAWLDSGLLPYPIAATPNGRLVNHENGVDDNVDGNVQPMHSFISSSEFDIDDGHNFSFVWRMLPDLTFAGSTGLPSTGTPLPEVTLTLYPMQNSGSGASAAGNMKVLRGTSYNITEEYTGQVYTRLRGRQMIFKIDSDTIGTNWQLGAPRIDIRPDGRR